MCKFITVKNELSINLKHISNVMGYLYVFIGGLGNFFNGLFNFSQFSLSHDPWSLEQLNDVRRGVLKLLYIYTKCFYLFCCDVSH